MSWGPNCLLLCCVLICPVSAALQSCGWRQKSCMRTNVMKGEPASLCRTDKMSERMPWNDTPGTLPAVCQDQEVVVTLISKVVSSCLQWCFHPFCMFPGQNSACYLLKEMRLCSCAFPLHSYGSYLHFPKVILSNFNQNLYNIDFPKYSWLLINRKTDIIA